jgi:uncharacterized protein YqeY
MLLEKIKTEIITAMKAKDELRLNTLRSIKMALDKYAKETGEVTETVEQKVLGTLAKQRRESATAFTCGNRPELARKEQAELEIIESFMAQEATEEDVDLAVAFTINQLLGESGMMEPPSVHKSQMGAIIKGAQTMLAKAGKRVDGRMLSDKVKAKLK